MVVVVVLGEYTSNNISVYNDKKQTVEITEGITEPNNMSPGPWRDSLIVLSFLHRPTFPFLSLLSSSLLFGCGSISSLLQHPLMYIPT